MNCLNSSIGGYAPYISVAGIFTSSTKSTNFLPGGGIKMTLPFFLWFYIFYSIVN